MIKDDNSKEILKDPRSPYMARIIDITKVISRVADVAANKLPAEMLSQEPETKQLSPEITPIAPEQVLEPQLDLSGAGGLNIDTIRHNVVEAYREAA